MERIFRYKVKIPVRGRKLKERIMYFTTPDLEYLLNYYDIPYKKLDNHNKVVSVRKGTDVRSELSRLNNMVNEPEDLTLCNMWADTKLQEKNEELRALYNSEREVKEEYKSEVESLTKENKELKVQLNDLVERIIEMCFDSDNEDVEDDSLYDRLEANDYGFWKEVFCRKLVKYGYAELKDDYYKVKEEK